MIREVVIQVGTWLSPIRYGIETITYKLVYRPLNGDKNLMAWKDRFRGKPMLVVGNGPSLNKTPLDDFADIPSVGMNKIDILFPRTKWRPNVILCINDVVTSQYWQRWLELDIPVFLNWKSRWFVPAKCRRQFPYFLTGVSWKFSTNLDHGFGKVYSVTGTALQFAYWCGADPVIVFGVDHSFVQPEKAILGYEKREGADLNHFDPNYFAPGTYWGLANLKGNEADYIRAREAFAAAGRHVYDATVGGKLNVFHKISLDEARKLAGLT